MKVKRIIKDANEKFVIAIPQDKGDKNSYWVGNDGKLVTNIKNARIFTERIAAERVRNSRGDRGSIQTLVDAHEHIVETYHRNSSKYRIIKAPNGKFFNVYGDYKEATQAGPYDTLEEARKMMEKHRPKAVKDAYEPPKELMTFANEMHRKTGASGKVEILGPFNGGKAHKVALNFSNINNHKSKLDINEIKKLAPRNIEIRTIGNKIYIEYIGSTNDSKERLKTYNIKNHSTGVTYKVKAKSFKDAKDKYERYLKDRNSFEYKGYLVIKSSYGWKVKINNRIMEFATDKEAREYIDSVVKDSFSEDANIKYYAKEVKSWSREDFIDERDELLRMLDKAETQAQKEGHRNFEKRINNIQVKLDEVRYIIKNRLFSKDSFSEDATVAQLTIKQNFLEEDKNADDIKYLGFNEERKISFYEYGDTYYAFFDLENRAEIIDKEKVQEILKKTLIKESEKREKDLFREGDQGIATTTRAEDDESIPLSQFNPERLVKAVETRKMALHNYVKLNNNETYFIAVYKNFVSVVRIDKDNNQKRVVNESFENWDEAVKILKDVERKLKQGGFR